MTLGEIRKFRDQTPFQPFEILLVDGRKFRVPHRDFIWVPPAGTWVYVHDPKSGAAEHVNTVIISSIRHARPGRNGKHRKAG